MWLKLILGTLVAGGLLFYGLRQAQYANAGLSGALQVKEAMESRTTPEEAIRALGQAAPAAAVKPAERPDRSRFPRFVNANAPGAATPLSQGSGTVTITNASKEKCQELAAKWAGSVTVNGQAADRPETLCRGNNTLMRKL